MIRMTKATIGNVEYDLSDTKQRFEYWNKYAASRLLGKKIRAVFKLNSDSIEDMGWDESPNLCIQFADGSQIFPSTDDEGNGPGHFSLRSTVSITKLTGAEVINARYINKTEKEKLGFEHSSLMITFTSEEGKFTLLAQSDPAGNDAGAILGGNDIEGWTFPMLR